MHTDKQRPFGLIRHRYTPLQRQIDIAAARHHDAIAKLFEMLLNHKRRGERDFLFHESADLGALIGSPMARIEHNQRLNRVRGRDRARLIASLDAVIRRPPSSRT